MSSQCGKRCTVTYISVSAVGYPAASGEPKNCYNLGLIYRLVPQVKEVMRSTPVESSRIAQVMQPRQSSTKHPRCAAFARL